MMTKTSKISVLGSTGSIGRNTMLVAEALGIGVAAMAGGSNVRLMEQQARKYHPDVAAMYDPAAAAELKTALTDTEVKVLSGKEGVLEAASYRQADTVVSAITGMAGLLPSLAAIDAGKRLALANKETLVCAGHVVTERARQKRIELLPVDSEPSAIFQCLAGGGEVKRLILTASGGPFFGRTAEELSEVTVSEALKHPNWSMGKKVTIDSATLMNKGLELIEAMHFFSMPAEKISILVHPQSIIHSMVEFVDGAVMAQMGAPDMKLPIQLALTWPERLPCPAEKLDLLKAKPLTFFEPDMETFRCLAIARKVAASGTDGDAVVMNGANEAAVAAFIDGRIGFTDIPALIEKTLDALAGRKGDTPEEIIELGREAERYLTSCI